MSKLLDFNPHDANGQLEILHRESYYNATIERLHTQWRTSGYDIRMDFKEFAMRFLIEAIRRVEEAT